MQKNNPVLNDDSKNKIKIIKSLDNLCPNSVSLMKLYEMEIRDVVPAFYGFYKYLENHELFGKQFEKDTLSASKSHRSKLNKMYSQGIATTLIILYEKISAPMATGWNFPTGRQIDTQIGNHIVYVDVDNTFRIQPRFTDKPIDFSPGARPYFAMQSHYENLLQLLTQYNNIAKLIPNNGRTQAITGIL